MSESDRWKRARECRRHRRPAEAVALCGEILREDPAHRAALEMLAEMAHQVGENDRSARLDPGLHAAWYALGCVRQAEKNDAAAMDAFERAVAINPRHAASQHNLGQAIFRLGLVDEAIGRFRLSLALEDSFLPRTAIATAIPGSPAADNRGVLEARRDWARTHLPPPPRKTLRGRRASDRPVRIGYLSSFFQSRNWMKPVWGLINHHDRESFEIHLFSDAAEAECDGGYRPHPSDRFHDISPLSNRAAADLIEQSRLDLLVDLNAYSQIDRLAVVALKPAPIVIAWFNMFATSGMDCFDYLIGDPHVIPPEEEPFYSETILRVHDCYLTYQVLYLVPEVVDPPVLSGGALTFGCFASQYKLTPEMVEAWSRILRRSPGTRLLLKNKALEHAANRDFLLRRFAQHDIPAERIELEGPSEHFDYLAAYGRVDVALDTDPYNGGTTTSEALWQGVPVLCFPGDRWTARQSTSLLRAGGLEEYIATSLDDYVERAVSLAAASDTPARLAELRHTMRARLADSPLCDSATFTRQMERLFLDVFEEALRQCR